MKVQSSKDRAKTQGKVTLISNTHDFRVDDETVPMGTPFQVPADEVERYTSAGNCRIVEDREQ